MLPQLRIFQTRPYLSLPLSPPQPTDTYFDHIAPHTHHICCNYSLEQWQPISQTSKTPQVSFFHADQEMQQIHITRVLVEYVEHFLSLNSQMHLADS